MMIVESALNVAPNNSESGTGNTWNQWSSSAPYLMRNGSLAAPFKDLTYNILSGEASNLHYLDGARACSADGTTAYFYMISQTLTPAYAWGTYVPITGAKNVGSYGLDLSKMGGAADWISSKYQSTRGYTPQFSPTGILNDLTGSDPVPYGLFINLPVLKADGIAPPDIYSMGGEDGTPKEILMMEVLSELPYLKDWAYPDSVTP
ncbi:hypothetical protein N7510_004730 [Penicillium lagena]|uniref:uncharacterized protein n=1 Tax=Penicillium lagena TaxID=94218 RepID=UPI0025419AC5|nr:uncharacterized protein N7510_004730 [Penicillium lagena]KAJ5620746.1 hypothetical protein N7510_004730 [Penicillium lagena]